MCYLHSHVINVSIFLTLFRLAQKKNLTEENIKFNTLDFYNHKPKGGWFEIELKADFANRSNQILS